MEDFKKEWYERNKDLSDEEKLEVARNDKFILAMKDTWNNRDFEIDDVYDEIIEELEQNNPRVSSRK